MSDELHDGSPSPEGTANSGKKKPQFVIDQEQWMAARPRLCSKIDSTWGHMYPVLDTLRVSVSSLVDGKWVRSVRNLTANDLRRLLVCLGMDVSDQQRYPGWLFRVILARSFGASNTGGSKLPDVADDPSLVS